MTFMSAPQKWFAIDITVKPDAAEAIEYAFNTLDSLGTEINHLPKSPGDAITVIGYFNKLPNDEAVLDEIHYSLRVHELTEDAVLTIERREVENRDWLIEWKKHWKPTETSGFIIAPPWETVADNEKIVISIEPNMAFGTGTHETTRLCLEAINKYYDPGESFLDVGTGTGILAIAAAKLNDGVQTEIVACDIDADSIAIARENATLNGVADMIVFEAQSVTAATRAFDFVCANLTLDVILPNLHLLVAKTRRVLVLSGILLNQEDETIAALRGAGISNAQVERSGEWIAVIAPRN